MMKHFLKNESLIASVLFLIKTVLFYFAFNYFFLAYAGLTIEGGELYSRFLAEHFDFITGFRDFLLWGGTWFTNLLGYPSSHDNYTIYVQGVAGVRIIYTCLGFSLMSAYTALLLAWPAGWRERVISLTVGTSIIILLNMIRLGGLAVLFVTGHYDLFENINHHDIFNGIVLVVCFVMFVIHVHYSDKHRLKDITPTPGK